MLTSMQLILFIYFFTDCFQMYSRTTMNMLKLNTDANKNDKDKYQEKVSFYF